MRDGKEDVTELKNNRIYNTARTSIAALLYTSIVSIVPFFIRTLMIYNLGDKYAGLSNVITSVVAMINIAEMGMNETFTFFLYRPLSEGDTASTSCYLALMRKLYRIIGTIVLVVGIIITPFLPRLIHDSIPRDVNVYMAFLIYLFSVCIQYYCLPEIMVLTFAFQRGDISYKVNFVANVCLYVFQLLAIVVFKSFTVYYVSFAVQCIIVFFLRLIVRMNEYGDFAIEGKASATVRKQINNHMIDIVGHQLDEKLLSSIDNVVISAFMDLTIVAIYGNYMLVVSALSIIFSSFYASLTASLGNALVTESREANLTRFNAVLWMNGVIVAWATICMACLYQAFMNIWMGEKMVPDSTMLLFCVFFYVTQIRKTVLTFKNAAGIWHKDRLKPYVSMILNIILDIILVKHIGINGALLSSIVCISLIEIPWESEVVFCECFRKQNKSYIRTILLFLCYALGIGTVFFLVTNTFVVFNGIITLVLYGIILSVIYYVVTFAFFRNSSEARIWKETLHLLFHKG